jgi:hypothetical protein
MYTYLASDINGYDIKSVTQAVAVLGLPGIIGALLGLAVGAAVSNHMEEKGWGNPSKGGIIYWPVWGIAGAIAGVFVWTTVLT